MRNKYQTYHEFIINNGIRWNQPPEAEEIIIEYINHGLGKPYYEILKQYDVPNFGEHMIWVMYHDPYVYCPKEPGRYLLESPANKLIYFVADRDLLNFELVIKPALDDRLTYFEETGRLKNYFLIMTQTKMPEHIIDKYKDVASFFCFKKNFMSTFFTTVKSAETFDKIKQPKNITKHFLSLNNRATWDRQALFYFMNNFDLLDTAYFSYLAQESNRKEWGTSYDRLDDIIGPDLWFTQNINRKELKRKVPYSINDSLRWDDNYGRPEFYTETFCSVILETYYTTTNEFIITEKTIKPLAFEHPFLLFGPKGCLKELKSYGFETFSDVFDESYDEIDNEIQRLEAIFKEMLRISKFSIEECVLLQKKLNSRLMFNRKHLIDTYYDNMYSLFKEGCDVSFECATTKIKLLDV